MEIRLVLNNVKKSVFIHFPNKKCHRLFADRASHYICLSN